MYNQASIYKGCGEAEKVEQLASNIAPNYTKKTYEANSYVMQGGVLYTNPNAIETAEDWNPAHWTRTTIPEVVDDKIDEVTLDPSEVALGNVHNLDEVTSFAADAKILVDSETNGPGAMPAENLLKEAAQKTLSGNVVEAFDPTRDSSNKYIAGKDVVVYDGKIYVFKNDHYGAWNFADVEKKDLFSVVNVSDIVTENETFTQDSTYDDTKNGYYANTDGYYANALYDTYVFEAVHNGKIYPSIHSNSYFSIVVFDNASQNSGVRYRKVSGGEDTLPTEGNPASFVKGNYIAITTPTEEDFAVVFNDYKVERVLKNDIIFSQGQKEQILSLQKSKIICKFINSGGADNSTQRFEVFVPSKVGYVKYVFVHSVSISKNTDCWRISNAFAVDDNFSTRFQLTGRGEWECAIRLVGRSDFSGGIIHGNEILIDASFWADGEKLDISSLSSDPFYCSEFRVSTSTHLYDNADGTTNFADHGCEHIFSVNGCEISQSVKFIINSNLFTAYMAMGLPSASVTDHYYVDSEISGGVAAPVDQNVITSDLRKFVIFGENTGVLFTMELLDDYPFLQNPYRGLLVHSGYNKSYFVVLYNDNYTAAANSIWITKHKVNFDVGL